LQLNAESHFHNDLGLDSLDTVEVVMAIEEVSHSSGPLARPF
jgi:acyl carrier protein